MKNRKGETVKKNYDKTIYKQKPERTFRQTYFCNDIDTHKKIPQTVKQENPEFVLKDSR